MYTAVLSERQWLVESIPVGAANFLPAAEACVCAYACRLRAGESFVHVDMGMSVARTWLGPWMARGSVTQTHATQSPDGHATQHDALLHSSYHRTLRMHIKRRAALRGNHIAGKRPARRPRCCGGMPSYLALVPSSSPRVYRSQDRACTGSLRTRLTTAAVAVEKCHML